MRELVTTVRFVATMKDDGTQDLTYRVFDPAGQEQANGPFPLFPGEADILVNEVATAFGPFIDEFERNGLPELEG